MLRNLSAAEREIFETALRRGVKVVSCGTTDEFNLAIDRAFRIWVEKYDPENKLKPIEQAKAYLVWMRERHGLPNC